MVPAIKERMVGYQTRVLIHWSQIVKKATFSPKACLTQLNIPPSSSDQVDESSAETRATGIKRLWLKK